MTRQELFAYVRREYGTEPEYLWASAPDCAVLRASSGKWYGIVMDVPRKRLGLEGDEPLNILNVKCGPVLVGSLRQEKGFLPAYHMNKQSWISISLDGTVGEEEILPLLEISYHLAMPKRKKVKEKSDG